MKDPTLGFTALYDVHTSFTRPSSDSMQPLSVSTVAAALPVCVCVLVEDVPVDVTTYMHL